MATRSFSASLKHFRDMTTANMLKVAKNSISDVVVAAQTTQRGIGQGADGFEVGKIPVDTSELVNSLTVDGATGADAYAVGIGNMELGDVLRFAWTAPHALPMELGFTAANGRQVPGRHFVGANAARFEEFVAARAAEVRK